MTKKTAAAGSSALATADASAGTGLAVHDELADIGFDFGDDGLSEADRDDIKIAAKVFNFKGVDKTTGNKIPEDVFFDTVDETVKERVDAAFLDLHKTNLYQVYNNELSKNEKICSSFDRVTGTMKETGVERPCKGCPDAEWRNEGNKRVRNCGPVYNIFAIDRETQLPFVVRFKRSSMPEIKSYLQKHFIGRRVMAGGKRLNYPLFAFQTELKCRMSSDGKYALPVFTRGDVLSADEIRAHAESQKFVRENMLAMINRAEEQVEQNEKPDTTFDTDKFAAEEGKDFVDTTGHSTAA